MISLTAPVDTATKPAEDTFKPQKPSPGPVLMADILSARAGRPALLAIWSAGEQHNAK